MKKALLALLIATLFTARASAALVYWDANGATTGAGGATPTGTWGVDAFWSTDGTNGEAATAAWAGAADTAVFSASGDATGTYSVTVSGTQNLTGLTVEEGTITHLTGTLNFGAVNGVINVATDATWNVAGTGTGTLAGTNGLVKNGGGTLKLGTTEGYSRASGAILTVNGGVAEFSGDDALGDAPGASNNAAITLNGGTLRYTTTATTGLTLATNRGLTIGASGGTVEIPELSAISGVALATNAVLAGNGIFTKTGTGRFTLGTTGTFTGNIRVLGGALNFATDTRLGPAPGSADPDWFILDNGALRISLTSTQTISATRGITLGAGGGRLIQPGPSGATDGMVYNGIIAGTAGGALTIDWQDPSSTNAEGGAAGGIITLGGNNTYNGATLINAGTTLRTNNSTTGTIPDTSLVTITGTGAVLDLGTKGFNETVKSLSSTGTASVTLGAATLTLANPAGETNSLTFTGNGKVVKNGSGAITFSGNSSSFTGEFIITDGRVGVGQANAFGTNLLTINGGGIANNAASGRTMTIPLNIGGSFTVDDLLNATPGQISFNTGAITLKVANPTITVNTTAGGYILPLGAVIGDEGAGRGLTKAGNGIISMNNAGNTYTGATTIQAGAINVDGDGSLGSTSTPGTVNLSGGKLNATGNRTVATPNAINVTADSSITTSSNAASVEFEFSSNSIGGSGGTLTFKNEGADSIDPLNPDVFKPRLSGSGFNFARPIVLDNGAATEGKTELNFFNIASTTQTLSGDISGSGSIRRSASSAANAGTTILTGSNTYSGGTAVSRGTLLVNNTSGSGTGTGTVTVTADGRLGGSGTIGGDVVVEAGGEITPGTSPGTLTISGGNDLSLNPMSDLVYDITAGDQTTGSNINDLIDVSGSVVLGGVLSIIGSGDFSSLTGSEKWVLITYDGTIDTTNMLTVGPTQPALTGNLGWGINVDTTLKEVQLVLVTVVPEASSFAAVGVVALLSIATIWMRKRMRRAAS